MAVFEIHGGPITHRYLMNKSKHDLARMYMELLDRRREDNRQVKAVVEYLCEHEGAEGFSADMNDRIVSLYERLGIEP